MPSGPTPNGGPTYQNVLDAIAGAVQSSNLSYASRLADQALARGIRHPTVFNARALWLQELGRFEDALAEYKSSRVLQPNDPTLLFAIGLCLLNLNRMNEALTTFDGAIAIDPNQAQTHYSRGWVLSMLGEDDAAQSAYERAVALAPNHTEALACLASVAGKKANAALAREYAQRALKINPHQPVALAALASLDIAKRAFPAAEAKLRPALDQGVLRGKEKAVVLGLLVDSLDGQGRFAEAFAAYTTENAELRRWYAPQFLTSKRLVYLVDRLVKYFEAASVDQWRPPDDGAAAMGGAAQHIFLLGFMRSGTTLLEQILACSTEIIAMEEQEFLLDSSLAFLTTDDGLEGLAHLDGAALTARATSIGNAFRSAVLTSKVKFSWTSSRFILLNFP